MNARISHIFPFPTLISTGPNKRWKDIAKTCWIWGCITFISFPVFLLLGLPSFPWFQSFQSLGIHWLLPWESLPEIEELTITKRQREAAPNWSLARIPKEMTVIMRAKSDFKARVCTVSAGPKVRKNRPALWLKRLKTTKRQIQKWNKK